MECNFKRKFQLNMDGISAGANYNYNVQKILIFVTCNIFLMFNLSYYSMKIEELYLSPI